MPTPSFDPGLTEQVTGTLRRAINKDGTFNVERRGGSWKYFHPYLLLISTSWPWFFGIVFAAYLTVNTIFALIYFSLGPDQLVGVDVSTELRRFLSDFFFSAHTLTTVGYGNFAPVRIESNFVAAFEALVGLMGFAIATGLFFGRVSRPSAKIGFSDQALVAPYRGGKSLQFRVVNLRPNILIEIQASVMLMIVDGPPGQRARRYTVLNLEREQIYFLPLTWTVVHPIDDSSPLWGKTPEELERLQAEILILLKGFDDTFSQTVNARYSYRYDEVKWGAKFIPAFDINSAGQIVLDVDRVGKFAATDL